MKKTETKNGEAVEGFTGGEWEVDTELHDSPFHELINGETVIAHIFNERSPYGITKEKAEANAAIIEESKKMYYALKELMRFENLFNHVAPELQYPDNFLKAVNEAKAILNRINNK